MKSEYEGVDLEAMCFAENYHRWIFEDIRTYLGQRVLEVGAGAGSFTKLLLETQLEVLAAIEPSRDMFKKLEMEIGFDETETGTGTRIQLGNGSLREIRDTLSIGTFDSVLYVNVLEHIEDDAGELAEARTLLDSGGVVIIYVPAMPSLFGPFDKRVGHHRRYAAKGLADLAERAGFRIITNAYRDLTGVVPWWFQSRILKSDTLRPWSVRLYDKFIPVVRFVDRVTGPPIGKNLLLIAEAID